MLWVADGLSVKFKVCYDDVGLFKYEELRKLRNKVIIIVVFMLVECFT